jgi:hypothetical protein
VSVLDSLGGRELKDDYDRLMVAKDLTRVAWRRGAVCERHHVGKRAIVLDIHAKGAFVSIRIDALAAYPHDILLAFEATGTQGFSDTFLGGITADRRFAALQTWGLEDLRWCLSKGLEKIADGSAFLSCPDSVDVERSAA